MFLLALCLLLQPLAHSYRSYSGHSVIRVLPSDEHQIEILHDLWKNSTTNADLHFNFWKYPSRPLQPVDIQVNQAVLNNAQDVFNKAGVDHRVMIEDVQQLMQKQRRVRRSVQTVPWSDNVISITEEYHTYSEIIKWLEEVSQACGSSCQLIDIGQSSEGRKMVVLKISSKPNLPAVWIDGGLHAREWISPATVLYLVQKLIGGIKGTDAEAKELTDKYSFYILPMANPDGYEYSWTSDRMWRKTRSANANSACKGTDPNRNWNFYWGGHGTSSDPCAENYRGAFPFSEPETRAMANFMWSIRDNILLYLTFHSYGQYWLLPWGFSYLVPRDYADLINTGNQAIRVLSNKYGAHYQIGTAARVLYRASGGSDDWVKGRAGVKYSYTIELGDTGKHGFLLPPQYITSTGNSMFDALHTLLNHIETKKHP